MKVVRLCWIAAMVAVMSGCTSYSIKPLANGYLGRKVVIVDNTRVVPRDVGPRLKTEFESRGFEVTNSKGLRRVSDDDLFVTYDVRRTFNIWVPCPWVNYIAIKVFDADENCIAEGLYRHRMGTLSFAFSSLCTCSRTKARPLFSEFFSAYPRIKDGEF